MITISEQIFKLLIINLSKHICFKPCFELATVGATVMSAGKLFHNLGPHTLNDLAIKVCLVTLGTTNLVEELSECNPGLIGI